MPEFIRIQPARALRRDFAVWATAQTPKVRTVSTHEFAVPVALFTAVPEEVLIGSLVDGHRYVSPDEEETPAPVLPERTAVPGEPLPELPEEAYGPDAVPLDPPDFAPLEDAPADEEAPGGGAFTCEDCQRPYATDRGLATHRRQKHGKGA